MQWEQLLERLLEWLLEQLLEWLLELEWKLEWSQLDWLSHKQLLMIHSKGHRQGNLLKALALA